METYNPNDLVTEKFLLGQGCTCERDDDNEYIYRIPKIYQFVIIRYNRYDTDFYVDGTDIQIKYVRHYFDLIKICKEEDE